MSTRSIRVVLADDHAVVRAGLKAVLGTAWDIAIVGEAANGTDALTLAEQLRPDVVVMDLAMDGGDGIEATKAIVARDLPSHVLILTMHSEDDYLAPLLEAGARGFLMKSAADRELVAAVRTVARGEVYVRPAAERTLAPRITREDPLRAERARYGRLTEREREVLRLTAQGYSAPEIGEQLAISPKTVDTYKQRIHDKLGFAHRADYVQFALKLGLLARGAGAEP
ncbi:MAG TPA: response regulator transcription factor [Gemmatimonadaceae bacterium]|nr:response regulator transcription factor [Gemmatimonadaceae bacterium]